MWGEFFLNLSYAVPWPLYDQSQSLILWFSFLVIFNYSVSHVSQREDEHGKNGKCCRNFCQKWYFGMHLSFDMCCAVKFEIESKNWISKCIQIPWQSLYTGYYCTLWYMEWGHAEDESWGSLTLAPTKRLPYPAVLSRCMGSTEIWEVVQNSYN